MKTQTQKPKPGFFKRNPDMLVFIALGMIGLMIVGWSFRQNIFGPYRWEIVTDGESYGFVNWNWETKGDYPSFEKAKIAAMEDECWIIQYEQSKAADRLKKWKVIPPLPTVINQATNWFLETNVSNLVVSNYLFFWK